METALTIARRHCAWARGERLSKIDVLQSVGAKRPPGSLSWRDVEKVVASYAQSCQHGGESYSQDYKHPGDDKPDDLTAICVVLTYLSEAFDGVPDATYTRWLGARMEPQHG